MNRVTRSPDELRLVGICDPHFTASNPASYKQDYLPILEASIRQVFAFAERQEADAIVWAGDLFHLKSSSRNPLKFITRVIRLLKETPIPHLTIAGNHDLLYGSLEGLHGQPIELLIESGVVHLLDRESVFYEVSGQTVEVAGVSYDHGKADRLIKWQGAANQTLLIGHFWFGPASGNFFGEPVTGPDQLKHSQGNIFLIGHHHEDQGVVQADGKTYVAAGSVTRTGAHAQDLERRPAASYITYDGQAWNVQILRPKVPPASEIIDQERRRMIREEQRALDAFLESIKMIDLTAKDPLVLLKEMDVERDVRERAQTYLEGAGHT